MSSFVTALHARLTFATYLGYTVFLLLLLVSLLAHRLGLLSALSIPKVVLSAVPILACAPWLISSGSELIWQFQGQLKSEKYGCACC